MKKFIIGFMLLGAILVSAPKARAITIDDLANQISILMGQVSDLKAELSAAVALTRTTTTTTDAVRTVAPTTITTETRTPTPTTIISTPVVSPEYWTCSKDGGKSWQSCGSCPQSQGTYCKWNQDRVSSGTTTGGASLVSVGPTTGSADRWYCSNDGKSYHRCEKGESATYWTWINERVAPPVTTPSANKISTSVVFGSRNNPDIKVVQQRLFDLGYLKNTSHVSGNFLGVTKTAIMKFQKDHGLKVDGVYGQITASKIFTESISAGSQPSSETIYCSKDGFKTHTVSAESNCTKAYQNDANCKGGWCASSL